MILVRHIVSFCDTPHLTTFHHYCNVYRVPTFLGSKENVFELDQFYRYYGDEVAIE